MKTKLAMLILLAVILVSCRSNESSALVQSDTAILGQELIFPSGYHLVSFAIYNTDMTTKIVYICQSADHSVYRICVPETK